jgi:hypothetical protein
VAGGAGAGLQEAAHDRETGVVEVQERRDLPHAGLIEQFGVHPVQPHGVAAADLGVALGVGVGEVQDAPLADHGVVVEVLLHPFPQLHRQLVERDVAGQHVVGADDGGVAADVAAADPALLHQGHVGDPVLLGQVVGRGEAVAAPSDDDHVVGLFGRCVAPGRLPELVAVERVRREAEYRIAHDRKSLSAPATHPEPQSDNFRPEGDADGRRLHRSRE